MPQSAKNELDAWEYDEVRELIGGERHGPNIVRPQPAIEGVIFAECCMYENRRYVFRRDDSYHWRYLGR